MINSFVKVNELKLENPKNVLTGNLYVNSLRYKSSSIEDLTKGKIDILFLSETKIDETSLTPHFEIWRYIMVCKKRISPVETKGSGLRYML